MMILLAVDVVLEDQVDGFLLDSELLKLIGEFSVLFLTQSCQRSQGLLKRIVLFLQLISVFFQLPYPILKALHSTNEIIERDGLLLTLVESFAVDSRIMFKICYRRKMLSRHCLFWGTCDWHCLL